MLLSKIKVTSKIRFQLQKQLEENVSVHKDILNMSKDIIDVIVKVKKKIKKRW